MSIFKKKNTRSRFDNSAARRTLHKNLEFTATEQYKLLRTNLDFTIPEGTKCPVVGVTSSMRGEGKSTTAVNLSYVLAEKGSRVLLIDGDLRIPSVAKKMDIPSTPGLTDVLMNHDAFDIEKFKSEHLDNWYILPAGDIPPNPSELLGSKRMEASLEKFREIFDYVIIDLPPVNIVSDAMSISPLITGLIIVVREEYTERKELERCFRQLKLANVNILGCVMNGSKSGGGYYNRYKRYRYYKYSRYYKNDYRYYKHDRYYGEPPKKPAENSDKKASASNKK